MAWKSRAAKGYGLGKGGRSAFAVVMQTPQYGINLWGPFADEAAATEWVRVRLEDEIRSMWDTANIPGMVTYVTYMPRPCVQVWVRDKEEA